MDLKPDIPFYSISQTATLVGVTADRLRTYDEEGLIKPYRNPKNKRLYSQNDITYLKCIRKFIHEYGISIKGLKLLLELMSCSELLAKVSDNPACESCGIISCRI